MQKSLIPVNAICSFCKWIPPWPSVLAEAGYHVAGIEQLLSVASLTIKPDLITVSSQANCAILWECKSGSNLDRDQFSRYQEYLKRASAKDVQRVGNLRFREPETACIDIAYCVLEEAASRMINAVHPHDNIPIVTLGATTRLVVGRFSDSSLHGIFETGFATPPVEHVPWRIVADAETTDAEYARYLFPTLVSLIPKQPQRVSISTILATTLVDWEAVSLDSRRMFREKAMRILRNVCHAELANHFRLCRKEERRHEETVEITSTIMSLDSSSQTKAFQKLRTDVESAIKRIEEGRDYVYERQVEGQLELFGNLDGNASTDDLS